MMKMKIIMIMMTMMIIMIMMIMMMVIIIQLLTLNRLISKQVGYVKLFFTIISTK